MKKVEFTSYRHFFLDSKSTATFSTHCDRSKSGGVGCVHGILDLVKVPLGGENCDLPVIVVVPSGHCSQDDSSKLQSKEFRRTSQSSLQDSSPIIDHPDFRSPGFFQLVGISQESA